MTAKRLGFAVFLMAALLTIAGLPWIAPTTTTMMPLGVSVAFAGEIGPVEGDPDAFNGGGGDDGVEGDPDEFVGGGENSQRQKAPSKAVKSRLTIEDLREMASEFLNGITRALF